MMMRRRNQTTINNFNRLFWLSLLIIMWTSSSVFIIIVSARECNVDSDCGDINCLIPPCPISICLPDGTCGIDIGSGAGEPEVQQTCVKTSDCDIINCFGGPCEYYECIQGICELQPASNNNNGDGDGGDEDTVVIDNSIVEQQQEQQCGKVICPINEVCCNPLCSICTIPGGICTERDCGDDVPSPDNNNVEQDVTEEPQMVKPIGNNNDNPENDNATPPTQEEEDDDDGLMNCSNDNDCPVIACFAPPCIQFVCSLFGQCVSNQTTVCGIGNGNITNTTNTTANATTNVTTTSSIAICNPGWLCCEKCGVCILPDESCTAMVCNDEYYDNFYHINNNTNITFTNNNNNTEVGQVLVERIFPEVEEKDNTKGNLQQKGTPTAEEGEEVIENEAANVPFRSGSLVHHGSYVSLILMVVASWL